MIANGQTAPSCDSLNLDAQTEYNYYIMCLSFMDWSLVCSTLFSLQYNHVRDYIPQVVHFSYFHYKLESESKLKQWFATHLFSRNKLEMNVFLVKIQQ